MNTTSHQVLPPTYIYVAIANHSTHLHQANLDKFHD